MRWAPAWLVRAGTISSCLSILQFCRARWHFSYCLHHAFLITVSAKISVAAGAFPPRLCGLFSFFDATGKLTTTSIGVTLLFVERRKIPHRLPRKKGWSSDHLRRWVSFWLIVGAFAVVLAVSVFGCPMTLQSMSNTIH